MKVLGMAKRFRILVAMLALVFAPAFFTPALGVQPDEIMPDAGLEARARAMSAQLRCLVCQNQSIDDSNAPLARDLRLLVRERLKAGDSDQAVMDYVATRYGDFVLLKPPFNAATLLLWLTPLLAMAAAVWLARASLRAANRGTENPEALTAAERKKLQDVLGSD